MLLKCIHLKNFRQFKDVQSIQFSTSLEKNATVIIGKNTGGKTTLVQAFVWCLYLTKPFKDDVLLNQEKYVELYNKSIGAREEVEVTIELIHEAKKYIISRSMYYTLEKEGKIAAKSHFAIKVENENGALVPVEHNELDSVIYKILPKSLSDYFFFWGERIENLSNKSATSTAVKDFLGLTLVDNAKKHLEGAIRKFDTNGGDSHDSNIKKCEIKITAILQKIDEAKREIEEHEKNIQFYQEKYEEKKEILDSNASSANIKKNLDAANVKHKDCERRLMNSKSQLYSIFNKNAHLFYSTKVANKAVSFIEAMPAEDKGYAYQNKKSLQEILDTKECLCGSKLDDPSSESYQHFIEVFNKIAPRSIKSMCDEYKSKVKFSSNVSSQYSKDFMHEYSTMDDYKNDIEAEEEKLHELNSRFKNLSDMGPVKAQADSFLEKRKDAETSKNRLEGNIEIYEREMKSFIDKKDKWMEASNKYHKLLDYKRYATIVLERIKNEYEGKENEINERMNELVNSYFQKMYHGERILNINKEFKIELTSNVNGKKLATDASPGLETVKNFAFIAGLGELAKEKIGAIDDENSAQSEPYPLVLDAPFSQADEIHVPRICELISEVAEQTVIVVMKKDWAYAEDVMKDKVGKYYTLVKHSEVYTEIIEGYREEE